MTRAVADVLAWRGTGMVTDERIVAELRRIGVAEPERMLADPGIPDPSSAGFESRIARWLR